MAQRSAFSLLLFQPLLVSTNFAANLSGAAGWRRSIRAQGGFWQGACMLTGDLAELAPAFYDWLGYHLEERSASGLKTWEGLVYELELAIGGASRRRSLDTMANAVAATYQANGATATTSYSTQAQSVSRYGRKEEMLLLDNYPVATAEAYRATFLAEHAWPWARPLTLGAPGEATLAVRACGYGFTANWMFAKEAAGSSQNVSHWISSLVGTATGLSSNHGGAVSGAGDCQFLKVGNVATNTLQVTEVIENQMRPWDLIQELTGLGDSSGDPYQCWVDLDRKVHYAEISTPPRYYMRGGVLYDSAAARERVDPWTLRPAVIRDMDYALARAERGSFLDDARDAWIEQVEVDELGQITLSPAGWSEYDILTAQMKGGK